MTTIRRNGPLALLSLTLQLVLIAPTTVASEWQLEKETRQIQLYLRSYPDSDIPEFKATAVFNASMDSIMAVLTDVDGFPRWIYQCSEAKLLQTLSDRDYVIYQLNALPLVNDRDVIMRVHIERSDDGSDVTIALQTDPDFCDRQTLADCQAIRDTKFVRIKDSVGYYRLRAINDRQVELTWQQHIDPAGKLPAWLIKRTLLNLPIESLTALRELVEG